VKTVIQKKPCCLNALDELFQSLNRQGIRYCHWKSNLRLRQSLEGQTDLDLLVDPKHRQSFRETLDEHAIKLVRAAPGKDYPGIENYLGFDPDSGRLFHLHVHFRLVLGEQFVKNYHLPLETHFLDSAEFRDGVPIPSPEWELIVLCMRALLKYRFRDAVKEILQIRSFGLPAGIREEIRWLLDQTSMQRISEALQEVPEVVPTDIVMDFLQSFAETSSGYQRYRLRAGLRRALRPFQRSSRWQATLKYFHELWRRRKSFRWSTTKRKMSPLSGGKTVAFVGVDGAGKSTVIRHTVDWLSRRLTVKTYYLGSSQRSAIARISKNVASFTWLFHRGCGRLVGEKSVAARLTRKWSQVFSCLRFLAEAQDRYRRYCMGQRMAAKGCIVIYDRYPLRAIRMGGGFMDGPRIARTYSGNPGPVTRKLSQAEERIYKKILPPEHVVVLRVSPDVSRARKPDHRRETIEDKSQAIRGMDRDALVLTAINADKPLDDVLLQVKSTLWRLL
jgi:thymidylate kinase